MIYSHTKIDLQKLEQELRYKYALSSGPGGQNVNKVHSKVFLFWHLESSTVVSTEVKERFVERYQNKINQDGFLVLSSDAKRDQKQNQADCLEKLEKLLLSVLNPPKKRKKTKPSRSSIEKRIRFKKKTSEKKSYRKKFDF